MKFAIVTFSLICLATPNAGALPAKCQKRANILVRNIVQSGALKGRFLSARPGFSKKSISLPGGESETQEEFTYSNADGDNSVSVVLSEGLCELRTVTHNVPL